MLLRGVGRLRTIVICKDARAHQDGQGTYLRKAEIESTDHITASAWRSCERRSPEHGHAEPPEQVCTQLNSMMRGGFQRILGRSAGRRHCKINICDTP